METPNFSCESRFSLSRHTRISARFKYEALSEEAPNDGFSTDINTYVYVQTSRRILVLRFQPTSIHPGHL